MMLLELSRPIQAPRDIWVAFQFDRTTPDGPGLIVPELPITDQVGWSANWMLTDDGDGDLLPNGGIWSEDTNLSFMMEVYSQPGSLPAPGALGLGLAGVIAAESSRRLGYRPKPGRESADAGAMIPPRLGIRIAEQPSSANQRRHGRVRCNSISCSLGRVVDISAGGMCVRLDRIKAEVGEPLCAQIQGSDGPFEVTGRVVWARRRGLFGREVGLEFIMVTPEARKGLAALVMSASVRDGVARDAA